MFFTNAQELQKQQNLPHQSPSSAADKIDLIAEQSLQTIRRILNIASRKLDIRRNQNGAVILNLFAIVHVADDIPWVVSVADRLDQNIVQFVIDMVRNAQQDISKIVMAALGAFQGIVAPFETGCRSIGRNAWRQLRMVLRDRFEDINNLLYNSSTKFLSQNHQTGTEVNAIHRIALWQTSEAEQKRLQVALDRSIAESATRQKNDDAIIYERLRLIIDGGLESFEKIAKSIANRLRSIKQN